MRKLHDLFTNTHEKSNTDAKKFKCTASHALSLYAILGVFLTTVAVGLAPEVLRCYNALCDVLDLLVHVNRGLSQDAQMVDDAVHLFLARFVAVFSVDYLTPKFHWLLHFGDHIRHANGLLSCFVHERKHKVAKRYCTAVANTISYEKSVLGEAIL